jgi:multisubunit Na+/H+ antiporter MnhG subunit
MPNPNKKEQILGILLVVLGSALLITSVGRYLLEIIAAIIGVFIINYGLKMLEQPSLWNLIVELYYSIKFE